MANGKEFKFDFGDEFEDITSSSSPKKDEYEDIVSDSGRVVSHSKGSMNFNSFSDRDDDDLIYRKKKHGAAKFFGDVGYKIKKWWKCMKKGKKALLLSLVSLLLVITSLFVWFFNYFDYNYNNITDNNEDLGFENVIDEKIVNIALFGLDTRDLNTFEGNADSIMILSLNTETKKVKIISVVRDSLVPIERNGKTTYNKINSAYTGTGGGPELAIKTLNTCFGLDISEYATVNFYGMIDIIDAVGGIEATLTEQEVKDDPQIKNLNLCIAEICMHLGKNAADYKIKKAGTHHLNGIQAVAYSRIRYVANIWGTNNDYGRTDRQRYVMEQLFNKALSLEKTKYPKLAKALIPCTETSLSYSEILGLAFTMIKGTPSFEQTRIPQNTRDINFLMPEPSGSFGSVVYYDLDYAKKVVHAVLYDDMSLEEYVAQNGIEKNDWYRKLFPSSSTPKPSNPTPAPDTPDTPDTDDNPDGETPGPDDENPDVGDTPDGGDGGGDGEDPPEDGETPDGDGGDDNPDDEPSGDDNTGGGADEDEAA